MNRMPLSRQLTLLVALVMVVMGALVAMITLDLKASSRLLSYTVENRMVPTQELNDVMDAFQLARDQGNAVVGGSKTPAEALAVLGPKLESTYAAWESFSKTDMSIDEEQLFQDANGPINLAYQKSNELLERLRANELKGLDTFRETEHMPALAAARVQLRKLTDIQVVNAREDQAGAAKSFKKTFTIVLLAILAAVALSVGAAFAVIRGVMRKLGSDPAVAGGIAARVAGGDLDFDIPASQGSDESLVGALRQMKSSLLNSRLDYEGQLAVIGESQAVAEFTPEGQIVKVNENFAKAFGCAAVDLKGRSHDTLLAAGDRDSDAYRNFKAGLARGEAQTGQFRRVARDGRELWMQSVYAPIRGADGRVFKVVCYATDITRQRQEAALNAAFKGALQKLSAVVMVADNDGKIVYLNEAGTNLMKSAESDFRKDLPGFDASRLLGANIDQMHRNPGHQRGLLAKLTGTHTHQISLGGRTLRLVANPMLDDTGARLGSVVEWLDRTQELAAEAEVQHVVSAVGDGDLDVRIALEGKTGFFQVLATGVNHMVEAVAMGVAEQARLVSAANDGDLTARVETEGRSGLLVKIGSGLNQLIGNMSEMVSQVKAAAGQVTKGADEISQGNANLSQRTEEQASSLEETASSMEEMTSTVRQNADNAGQANQLAVAARDQAEKGGAVVAKAVSAMGEINGASKKIADIIGVIDEIAFQTNLLALNAAVEAARAGEQGRGFAVVATEVRNLAGRSATAAKEIKALIQDSVKKVEEGSNLVTQSGATLEQIVSSVKKVTDIVAEIAAASTEQSSGIDQVNKAVMQLDALTQQNAALVEEASAASQSMAEQARGLNDVMDRYRVGESSARAPRSASGAIAGERRKTSRPWTAPVAAGRPAAKAVRAPDRAGKSGTNDNVWQEF